MKITDSVQYLKGVGPKKKAELARLGIARVYDVLTYFPRTYEDQSALTRIADLRPGTVATVAGTIVNLQERPTSMTARGCCRSPGSTRSTSRTSSRSAGASSSAASPPTPTAAAASSR